MEKSLFQDKRIVIFDLESTNNNPETAEIVQFAARKFENNKLISKKNILIKVETKLNHDFIDRTRITEGLLEQKALLKKDAFPEILKFISSDTLISYKGNVMHFKLLWKYLNKRLKNPTLDVVDVADMLGIIDDTENISLPKLASLLGIEFDAKRWNNADYDVKIIEKIWFKLKSKME